MLQRWNVGFGIWEWVRRSRRGVVGESGVVALSELLDRLQNHCAFRQVHSRELCDKRTEQPLYLSSRTWYGHLYICVSRPDLFVESQSLYFDSMHNSTLL